MMGTKYEAPCHVTFTSSNVTSLQSWYPDYFTLRVQFIKCGYACLRLHDKFPRLYALSNARSEYKRESFKEQANSPV